MIIHNVCAVILDYFGSDKTVTCLNSLTQQGLDSVMIVDNSGDRQANIMLQEAVAKFSIPPTPFEIFQMTNPDNLGYATGVNKALRWLEEYHPHQYYLLINNDTEASPGMLSHLIEVMVNGEMTALVAPLIDDGREKTAGLWYHRVTGLIFSRRVYGAFQYFTGCCLLVDRQIIGKGLFDEDFFMYGEDAALCWKLKSEGRNFVCNHDTVVYHEGTGSSRQGGFFYEYHMARAHLLLVRKLAMGIWELPFLYIGRLLALSVRAVVRAIRYRSFVPITAWKTVLFEMNTLHM